MTMSEQPTSELSPSVQSIVEALDVTNTAITDQNERFGQLEQIDDLDFRDLALHGLTEEQATTMKARAEAVADVDYEALLREQQTTERLAGELALRLDEAAAQLEKIQQEAELTTKLAPGSATQIQELAEQKSTEARETADKLKAELAAMQARQTGYIALGAPWVVPLVYVSKATAAVEEQAQDTEALAPEPPEEHMPEPQPEFTQDSLLYLDPLERHIVTVLKSERRMIHIGEIVRSLGVERLQPEAYSALLQTINHLVNQGWTIHQRGTAWYRAANYVPLREVKPEVVAETTEPLLSSEPEQVQTTELAPSSAEAPETGEDSADELTLAILEYALSAGAFRMEELRRDVAAVQGMGNEEYVAFRHDFRRLQERILAALQAQGRSGDWQEVGRNRGKRYQLRIIERAAVTSEATTTAPVAEAPTELSGKKAPTQPEVAPLKYYDRLALDTLAQAATTVSQMSTARRFASDILSEAEADKFVESVRRFLEGAMKDAGVTDMKQTDVARTLGEKLNISKGEALDLTRDLVQRGVLYPAGSKGGNKHLSIVPVDRPPKRRSSAAAREKQQLEMIDAAKRWTEADAGLAVKVYDVLDSVPHQNQGIVFDKLARSIEDSMGMPNESCRALIHRMRRLGLVVIDSSRFVKRNSDHSRRIQATKVYFPTQQDKDDWKRQRGEVIQKFRSFIAEPSTESVGS